MKYNKIKEYKSKRIKDSKYRKVITNKNKKKKKIIMSGNYKKKLYKRINQNYFGRMFIAFNLFNKQK